MREMAVGSERQASERRPRGVVQFGETVGFEACSDFEASERRRDMVESAEREPEAERADFCHFWQ